MPQDNADTTGVGSPDIATNIVSASNALNYVFAPYSATVIRFNPAAPALGVLSAGRRRPPGILFLQLKGKCRRSMHVVASSSSNFVHCTSVVTTTAGRVLCEDHQRRGINSVRVVLAGGLDAVSVRRGTTRSR